MKIRSLLALYLLFLLCLTCQEKPKADKIDKVKMAQAFYEAMSASDLDALSRLYEDSIRVGEGGEIRAIAFEDYRPWLAWDSVFHPEYEVKEILELDSSLVVKVSKICERVLFLNEEPLVTRELLNFRNGKIHSLVIQEYVDYDLDAWVARREELVSWVAEKHPELDGFIHDQTLQGGLNYLKAIDLFQNRPD